MGRLQLVEWIFQGTMTPSDGEQYSKLGGIQIVVWNFWEMKRCGGLQRGQSNAWIHRGIDRRAKGIWTCGIQKASFLLWHVRWRRLPTFNRLINQGLSTNSTCLLCRHSDEMVSHLFHNCDFSSWLLRKSLEVAGSIINPAQGHSFEELGDLINRITCISAAWGLHG